MSALGKGLGSLIPNKVNIKEKKLNDNNLDIDYHMKNKTTYLDITPELGEKHRIAINNYHSKLWANRSGAPRWAAKNNIRYDYTIIT